MSEWKSYLDRYHHQFPNYALPKSTTCCWLLKEQSENYKLMQYFAFPDDHFCYDISSDVTSQLDNVGATFQSGLRPHCTTIPVWIDSQGRYSITGTGQKCNTYNVAWGSDGGKTKRRQFYNDNGGAPVPRLTRQIYIDWIGGQEPHVQDQAANLGML